MTEYPSALRRRLLVKLKPIYPDFESEDVIIAALEELLYQSTRKDIMTKPPLPDMSFFYADKPIALTKEDPVRIALMGYLRNRHTYPQLAFAPTLWRDRIWYVFRARDIARKGDSVFLADLAPYIPSSARSPRRTPPIHIP